MSSTARKAAIVSKSPEVIVDEDEGLEVKPETLLYAFDLMRSYATGRTNTAKLENNQELALSLVDWALMECDRGLKLLELQSELDLKPRPPSVQWP